MLKQEDTSTIFALCAIHEITNIQHFTKHNIASLLPHSPRIVIEVKSVIAEPKIIELQSSMFESIIAFYSEELKQLLNQPLHRFADVTSKQVPAASGVYVIYDSSSNQMIYAGRSKNLRIRLLQQHKSGNIKGSQFRKALGQKHNLTTEAKISDYIKENCSFKLLEVESFEEMVRLEPFITAIMAPTLNTELKQ